MYIKFKEYLFIHTINLFVALCFICSNLLYDPSLIQKRHPIAKDIFAYLFNIPVRVNYWWAFVYFHFHFRMFKDDGHRIDLRPP